MQSNPFAITIDGEQYPSVSKILQSDPKRKTYFKSVGARRKQAFKDGDAAATGRHRGDSLHEAFAQSRIFWKWMNLSKVSKESN